MPAEEVDSNDPEGEDLCRLHTLPPLKRRLMETDGEAKEMKEKYKRI